MPLKCENPTPSGPYNMQSKHVSKELQQLGSEIFSAHMHCLFNIKSNTLKNRTAIKSSNL